MMIRVLLKAVHSYDEVSQNIKREDVIKKIV